MKSTVPRLPWRAALPGSSEAASARSSTSASSRCPVGEERHPEHRVRLRFGAHQRGSFAQRCYCTVRVPGEEEAATELNERRTE